MFPVAYNIEQFGFNSVEIEIEFLFVFSLVRENKISCRSNFLRTCLWYIRVVEACTDGGLWSTQRFQAWRERLARAKYTRSMVPIPSPVLWLFSLLWYVVRLLAGRCSAGWLWLSSSCVTAVTRAFERIGRKSTRNTGERNQTRTASRCSPRKRMPPWVSLSPSISSQRSILETKLLLSPCIISSMHFSFLPAKINPSKIYNSFEFHRCIFPSFRSIRAFEEIKLLFTYSGAKDSRNILHRIKSNFILYRFEYKFSDNSPFQKHFFAANSKAVTQVSLLKSRD